MTTEIQVLEKPLTVEEVKERLDENGYFKVVIAVPFGDLVDCGGIDNLNDYADHAILHSGYLTDISYRAVGVVPPVGDSGEGEILVEVHGSFDPSDYDDFEEDN